MSFIITFEVFKSFCVSRTSTLKKRNNLSKTNICQRRKKSIIDFFKYLFIVLDIEEAMLRKLSIKSVRTALKEAEGIKSEEEDDG